MSAFLDTTLWAVIPAAGIGERMGAGLPKQYLSLGDASILQRTVDRLLRIADLQGVIVVLAADDSRWAELPASSHNRVYTCIGGASRAQSVVSGLQYLSTLSSDNSWVLVHDAARPLVALSDIQRLLSAVYNSGSEGGILAVPVHDTLKKSDEFNAIEQTVSRHDLWLAQTPQLFRCGQLLSALQKAVSLAQLREGTENRVENRLPAVTDEASAMELAGFSPLLVEALQPNFKITRPADLQLAEAFISHLAAGGAA